MLSLVSALFTLSLSAGAFSSDPYNNNLGQVVFSHVLFRHGERMPLQFYPTDPHQNSTEWPFKIAQLTEVGKEQEYELGRWLRQRYDQLVSKRYDVDEIYVMSTDTDRTLMSAQCVMAGLYQPSPNSSWNPAVPWQPIPVHTVPLEADCLLGATSTCHCPTYEVEVQRVMQLPEIQALRHKFKAMGDYATIYSGAQVQNFSSALKIYDTLAIEERYNMSLPSWTPEVYPEPIREAGFYSFVFPTWSTLMKRLKMGPLLKEMVEHFQAKRNGTLSPDRKLWVYSAHDATVSALLDSFKVFDIHFPPYSACVVLELRLIKQDYYVTLFYRNSTTEEPLLLPIRTCSTVCPLDQFVSLVQHLLPGDWDQECQLPKSAVEKYMWQTIIAVSGILGLALLLTLTFYCLKKKSPQNYFTMPSPLASKLSEKTHILHLS